MQVQQPRVPKREVLPAPKQQPKATWHRPTVTFVPLRVTAFKAGSITDGDGSTVPLD